MERSQFLLPVRDSDPENIAGRVARVKSEGEKRGKGRRKRMAKFAGAKGARRVSISRVLKKGCAAGLSMRGNGTSRRATGERIVRKK